MNPRSVGPPDPSAGDGGSEEGAVQVVADLIDDRVEAHERKDRRDTAMRRGLQGGQPASPRRSGGTHGSKAAT